MSSVVVDIPSTALKVGPVGNEGVGKKVVIDTMGCKVNTFESELIAEKLAKQGYQRSESVEGNDVFILNTCTVTAEADRQARQQVRRAIRRNPDAWIVITGCYAQIDPEACSAIPGVDLVVGNSKKLDIPTLLHSLYEGGLPPIMVDDIDKEISLPKDLVSGFEGRSRAFVQIQQGCDQGCTFCIIHTARGPNRSFAPLAIKRQVERLVLNGFHEIVICGVDIGSYGSDLDDSYDLSALLTELITIQGDFRLRLSSLDPAHITDTLIELMASKAKICPQLHLSMQSGNTLILKRMKRRATREVLYERIQTLREQVPDLVLSADVMVGFPTESEQHFAETCAAVEELNIPFPHIFTYSPRPGTPAARIPRQVPIAERKQRAQTLREIGNVVWQRAAQSLIGQSLKVLVEGKSDAHGRFTARAENYFSVKISPAMAMQKAWQEVEITGIEGNSLIARDHG